MEMEKEYFDKQVISYIKENEETGRKEINVGINIEKDFIMIEDEKILLAEREILGQSIKMVMPKSFSFMDETIANIKYPYESRPSEIYTNQDTDVNFTFSIGEYAMSADETEKVRNAALELIQKEVINSKILEKGTIHAKIGEIAFVEMITKASDMDIYSNMFFAEIHNQPLLGNFNCPEYEKENWIVAVKQMIESITTTDHE